MFIARRYSPLSKAPEGRNAFRSWGASCICGRPCYKHRAPNGASALKGAMEQQNENWTTRNHPVAIRGRVSRSTDTSTQTNTEDCRLGLLRCQHAAGVAN